MAHYLFNIVGPEPVDAFLRARIWGIGADETHGSALAAGDLVLLYLAAPERKLVGRAVLASSTHDWTPSEATAYPGDAQRGVMLAEVEEWRPPVPMSDVLARIDKSEGARADFESGVVRITESEYEAALSARLVRQ